MGVDMGHSGLEHCRRVYSSIEELARLDDRQLADFGVSRSDFLAIAQGNYEQPDRHRGRQYGPPRRRQGVTLAGGAG